MCFNSDTPKDTGAAEARVEAGEREAKIRAGQSNIDRAFGVFDPRYYDQFKKSFTDYYNPQVDKQFGDARQGLKYNLARAGTTNATVGQNKFGDLIQGYGQKREEIAAGASDASNKLRGSVDAAKGDLYAQNTASADPSLATISATSRAGALQTPPSFSPLGDVFGGLVNSGASYLYGRQRGLPDGYRDRFQAGGGTPGGVRVVT